MLSFALVLATFYHIVECAYLNIVNAGFEIDTLPGGGTIPDNTYRVDPNTPFGWSYYDPDGLIALPDNFIGILNPQNSEFFVNGAPEGNQVALTWLRDPPGSGEAGIIQQLSDTVTANTRYTLTVEIGDIASGLLYVILFVYNSSQSSQSP